MPLLRPLGATFSPPAILQRPPNINLLDWLASKSKLRKSEEEEEESTTENLFQTSTGIPSPLEESYYESFDYFPNIDHEYEAGAEIFEPEGQMLMVSMEDVDKDKVISGDIIYYDHEEADSQNLDSIQLSEDELVAENFISDSGPGVTSKRLGEENIGGGGQESLDASENSSEDEQYDEEDMANDESQNSFIVYPSNYIADFEEKQEDNEIMVDDFITSPVDLNPVEVITPVSEEVVTEEKFEDVMEKNNKIVDILKNTLQMQSALFNKFFGYVGWKFTSETVHFVRKED